jgi:hypothetical protein
MTIKAVVPTQCEIVKKIVPEERARGERVEVGPYLLAT